MCILSYAIYTKNYWEYVFNKIKFRVKRSYYGVCMYIIRLVACKLSCFLQRKLPEYVSKQTRKKRLGAREADRAASESFRPVTISKSFGSYIYQWRKSSCFENISQILVSKIKWKNKNQKENGTNKNNKFKTIKF